MYHCCKPTNIHILGEITVHLLYRSNFAVGIIYFSPYKLIMLCVSLLFVFHVVKSLIFEVDST